MLRVERNAGETMLFEDNERARCWAAGYRAAGFRVYNAETGEEIPPPPLEINTRVRCPWVRHRGLIE